MKIGVLGGGQLARMMALAGHPLGLEFVFLCPAHDACAAPLGEHLCAAFDDQAALRNLANKVDLITYEFENVPAHSVEYLSEKKPVYPPPKALATARDRLYEKSLFHQLGVATADFEAISSLKELQNAVTEIGLPAILKTRTLGYDGKGQQVIRDPEQLAEAWEALEGAPAILEAFVPFEREISIVSVRSVSGELVFYPLSENHHAEGILRLSTSLPGDPWQEQAETYAKMLLEHMNYVGVLAIEFFQLGDRLLANEMAPRVHNSGHWTIEGAETSQFENHLRAVMGHPLGDTAPLGLAAMVNFIGGMPDAASVLALSGAHLHTYGKSPRAGRKVGHATIRADDQTHLKQQVSPLLKLAESVDSPVNQGRSAIKT